MTFNPQFGLRSTELFDSAEGFTFVDPELQGISAGYLTLLSITSGTSYYTNNVFKPVETWSFINNLYNDITVTGDFLKYNERAISGSAVTQSGNQGLLSNIRAWDIITSYPIYDTGVSAYINPRQVGLYLGHRSPDTTYHDAISGGSEQFTIELDLVSNLTYSGFQGIQGYLSGNSLTSLSGVLNHGVYIQTTNKWDFIECTPEGIRSINHPEVAIPIDLLTPKRIRIGVRDTDLFIATEDGQAVYALDKFDTAHPDAPVKPMLYFGAPFIGDYSGDSTAFDVTYGATGHSTYGFYGRTIWDNIKILTGDLALYYNTNNSVIYSTGLATAYTPEFDPNIGISSFVRALITYVPYKGGTTTVYAQYSGESGWETAESVVLDPTTNVAELDLSTIPIYNYPRQNLGIDYTNNPIRFRIDQQSTDGSSLPPAVEQIDLLAQKERYKIDLLPNWKSYNSTVTVSIGFESGEYRFEDPQPEVDTTLLFNAPREPVVLSGQYASGYFTDESSLQIPLHFLNGTGEIIYGGRYGTCFKNYKIYSINLQSGTAAADLLGTDSVSNLFPNPLFENGFRSITNTEPNYITGYTDGRIADSLQILPSYTGSHRILLSQEEVYRLNSQAVLDRLGDYIGTPQVQTNDYVQKMYVYPSSVTHDGTVGIEAVVPSGIANGNYLVTFDINIAQGSGLSIAFSGMNMSSRSIIVNSSSLDDFTTISAIVSNTGSQGFSIGFNVPSGFAGNVYEYSIDNITVSPISTSYLKYTGAAASIHNSGLLHSYIDQELHSVDRASTVFNTNLLLDSYPLVASGILFSASGEDGYGFELNINSEGKLTLIADQINNSWSAASGEVPYSEYLGKFILPSDYQLPIGNWITVGFIHDVHTYDSLGYAMYSGATYPYNFASTNKLHLTVNGVIVASQDCGSSFTLKAISGQETAPTVSYIPLNGEVAGVAASGLICKIDGLYLNRPPIADTEAELSIKGARVTSPYFVPDFMYKGTITEDVSNLLVNSGVSSELGRDIFIGSCYNFSGPGYLGWDRGSLKNHALIYGEHSSVLNNPYSFENINSLRIGANGYVHIPYSSSLHRLVNTTGQFLISNTQSPEEGLAGKSLRINGWYYPEATGKLFTFYQSNTLLTGNRFEIEISTGNDVVYNKYDSLNDLVISLTGAKSNLNAWNFINLSIEKNNTDPHLVDGVGDSYTKVYLQTGEELAASFEGTGLGYSYRYISTSEFRIGREGIRLFNWNIYCPHSGDNSYFGNDDLYFYTSQNKGGRYQALLDGSSLYSGEVSWLDFNRGSFVIGPSEEPGESFFNVAMYDSYDSSPRLNGMLLYDNKPFKEVNSYSMLYNFNKVESIFGATNSPIRIGNVVPDNAINIAKFSSPEYVVDAAINTIDLSDYNVDNLVTYKRGLYYIQNDAVSSSSLTSYQDINEPIYAGLLDVTFSGKILSSDIEFTTLNIPNKSQTFGSQLTHYYLLGRGKNLFKLKGAYAHATGQISEFSSSNAENYIANLERVKNSIILKDRKGNDITNSIDFDIVTSPYTPDTLLSSIESNRNVNLDNIGQYIDYTNIIDRELYSVIILVPSSVLSYPESIFVHYPAYDPTSEIELYSHKEVLNPQPIFREKHLSEDPGIGKFDLNLNTNNFYDLTIYGIVSGYNGKL